MQDTFTTAKTKLGRTKTLDWEGRGLDIAALTNVARISTTRYTY